MKDTYTAAVIIDFKTQLALEGYKQVAELSLLIYCSYWNFAHCNLPPVGQPMAEYEY